MGNRILIVGAGANQVGIIRKARALGLSPVAVDGSAHAPGLEAADAAEVADICDPAALTRVGRAHAVSGVYPAAEWGVEAAAAAAAELGLPGVAPEVARRVRNKLAMREALEAAGIPTPRFRGVGTEAEAIEAARELGCPVIVKPADGNASKGVRRVDEIEEIPLAFQQAVRRSRIETVLIEEFMEGEEYNVDGLVFDGEYRLGGITGKERCAPPHRFDLGIYMPPLVDGAVQEAIAAATGEALAAIGFERGTSHVEVIVSPAGPRIVEMAGRPGGGRIPSDLIPLVYGVDYVADSLRVAMGEAPVETPAGVRGAALYWVPSRSGVVTAIEGVEAARRLDGVEDLVMAVSIGDTVGHIVDCATRDAIGYALTSGDTVEEAIATAKRACELCRVVTRPTLKAR
ncbi:MAG: ATP-grasp domain-containing protein [Candidatus Hydrogenedentes bacterium]|nr:ATP-grasp domain-containing protein [Candidatus Hydrogenedentota bacterium]